MNYWTNGSHHSCIIIKVTSLTASEYDIIHCSVISTALWSLYPGHNATDSPRALTTPPPPATPWCQHHAEPIHLCSGTWYCWQRCHLLCPGDFPHGDIHWRYSQLHVWSTYPIYKRVTKSANLTVINSQTSLKLRWPQVMNPLSMRQRHDSLMGACIEVTPHYVQCNLSLPCALSIWSNNQKDNRHRHHTLVAPAASIISQMLPSSAGKSKGRVTRRAKIRDILPQSTKDEPGMDIVWQDSTIDK